MKSLNTIRFRDLSWRCGIVEVVPRAACQEQGAPTSMVSIHNSFWFKDITSDRGNEVKRVEEKN